MLEADVILKAVASKDENLEVLEGFCIETPSTWRLGVKQGDQIWLNYLNTFLMNWQLSGGNEIASQKMAWQATVAIYLY